MNFSKVSDVYKNTSVVQKGASAALFDLLAIQNNEMVLDLGCGPGHITDQIRHITQSRVIGADPAEGMIQEAKKSYQAENLEFIQCTAEDLPYDGEFDVIYCNSAFQWFNPPQKSLKGCYKALKKGGRIGIQAPATRNYCTNFNKAFNSLKMNAKLSPLIELFTSPWLFLDTADEYTVLFEAEGFTVSSASIINMKSKHTIEEAFGVFSSGAANGYLDEACYRIPPYPEFKQDFLTGVKQALKDQADDDGMVVLEFNRIYLVANKH